MNILIYSRPFYPDIGGIETLVNILANEFTRLGHDVTIVTQTPAKDADDFPFAVVRRPGPMEFLELVRSCDVYFQPNISLRGLWPLAVVRRPWVASHNTWYARANGRLAPQDRLKLFLARFATGISISDAVAEHITAASRVIPNTYERVFRLLPGLKRTKDIVFAGRLVSDKGVDVLLDALKLLKARDLSPSVTIVGSGPEEAALRIQTRKLGLEDRVEFTGVKQGEALAETFNAHRILVVPSRWNEPFGIVALEGIACGCAAVGSAGGGLKDAIGPCGLTFPNGNSEALAKVLAELLTDDAKLASFQEHARSHLMNHRPELVASAYLQVFEKAINTRKGNSGKFSPVKPAQKETPAN